VTGFGLLGECLSELLNHPVFCRVFGRIEMEDLTTVVVDDDQPVQQAEGCRGDHEEVHGRDGLSVVAEKGLPTFDLFGRSRSSGDVPGHRTFGQGESQLLKFSMNPRGSPVVLGGHLADEASDLAVNFGTTRTGAAERLPAPE